MEMKWPPNQSSASFSSQLPARPSDVFAAALAIIKLALRTILLRQGSEVAGKSLCNQSSSFSEATKMEAVQDAINLNSAAHKISH